MGLQRTRLNKVAVSVAVSRERRSLVCKVEDSGARAHVRARAEDDLLRDQVPALFAPACEQPLLPRFAEVAQPPSLARKRESARAGTRQPRTQPPPLERERERESARVRRDDAQLRTQPPLKGPAGARKKGRFTLSSSAVSLLLMTGVVGARSAESVRVVSYPAQKHKSRGGGAQLPICLKGQCSAASSNSSPAHDRRVSPRLFCNTDRS